MAKAKNPKVPVPDDLTRDQLIAISVWIRGKAYPTKGPQDQFYKELDRNKKLKRNYVDECLRWHREKSVQCVDYVRAVQEWIRKSWEANERRLSRAALEKPQQPRRTTGKGFQPLSDTIDWIKRGKNDG
jgi:hypothetical protein